MPPSRWQLNIKNILSWVADVEGGFQDFLSFSDQSSEENPEGLTGIVTGAPPDQQAIELPPTLPILPLRGLVVYPQTAIPLTIGQPRSIRLVDDVMAGDQRLIGLVTSKDPDIENPEPQHLYQVGTVGIVNR